MNGSDQHVSGPPPLAAPPTRLGVVSARFLGELLPECVSDVRHVHGGAGSSGERA
jgi:hypothetical protein